jgi:peroxiredoxin
MTQLVELQEALPKFEAAGIKLYAVSYDAPEALADFAANHGITFPLLADRGSKIIRRLGILNHNVTRDQVPYYGIPFPGTYLLDEEGKVLEKFFNRNLADRNSAESMIDSALGEILLGEEEPTARGGDRDIKISSTYHGGGGSLKAGIGREIVVRFELAPGLHLYDDPLPDGMVATSIDVSGPPGFIVGQVVKPETHALALPGIEADLNVWDGRVDFIVPVHVDSRIASLVDKPGYDQISIDVAVRYQACDDKACRIPQRESMTVEVPIGLHTAHRMAGHLDGAVTTTMDSQKHMMKMVRRGLLRSPFKGSQFLKQTMAAIKRGPTRRRAAKADLNE